MTRDSYVLGRKMPSANFAESKMGECANLDLMKPYRYMGRGEDIEEIKEDDAEGLEGGI